MDDVLATTRGGMCRVRVVPDTDPQNPRTEFDQAANVITIDDRRGRYIKVDEDGGPLAGAWGQLDTDRVEVFIRWARIFHGAVVVDSDPGHGARALWYLTAERAAAQEITDPQAVIEGEIAQYRAWASGEVYGYVVERNTGWTNQEDGSTLTTWTEQDSCWGYYGLDDAQDAAREALTALEPHSFRLVKEGTDFLDRSVDFMECGQCGLLVTDIQFETNDDWPSCAAVQKGWPSAQPATEAEA